MKKRISVWTWCLVSALGASHCATAQSDDPFSIRVQSNLVLIHTEVYDKRQSPTQDFLRCRLESKDAFYSLRSYQPFRPPDCFAFMVMHNLRIDDFNVFEDGIEQKIARARYEPNALFSIRDNLGTHLEWSHTPQAKWSSADVGTGWIPAPLLSYYQLSYVPSNTEKGKCRKVKVTVNRPNAVVYATDQYCYVANPATDPLEGTPFGSAMEADLSSSRKARLPLSVATGFFFLDGQTARVSITLSFPWNRLRYHRWHDDVHASIGVLGVIYKKDGSIAARFSDFACCSSATRWLANRSSIAGNLPSRYETQLDLPTDSEYELRVVLSDGEKFGRAVMPLRIDGVDRKLLAIGSILFCNRYRDANVAAEEAAEVNLAPRYVPLVSKHLQFTPAGQTHFKSADHLMAYFEVYDPLSSEHSTTDVNVHVRIVNAQTGETKFRFDLAGPPELQRKDSGVVAFAPDLNASRLATGDYRVEVTADDSDGNSTAVRAADFSIR